MSPSRRTTRNRAGKIPGRKCVLASLLVLVIAVGGAIPAAAFADLYPREQLMKSAKRLQIAVRNIYERGILPSLTAEETTRLGHVTFAFPLPRKNDDLLNFYAYRKNGRAVVTMPLLSLVALEDLTTAYAWLYQNGYSLSTIDLYFTMLRYRRRADFPGGRIGPPLEALSIPADALDDKRVDTLSLGLRNEAIAFIMIHELGHLYYRHRGYGEITKARARRDETEADRFAFDILARTATPPLGAVLFFQAQVYRFNHPGEFPTKAAWETYLAKRATHPLTVDRLRTMVRYMSGPLTKGRPGERRTWLFAAAQLGKIVDTLEDRALMRCMARVAERAPIDILKPRRTTAKDAMATYCKGQ